MVAIFTGGKSTAINSPRHLTLRHARRAVVRQKRALGTLAVHEDIPEPPLLPGQEELHSYWAPGLDAGPTYRVEVSQTVTDPTSGETLPLTGSQIFTVDAPQFVLPADSVYSVYPPPGYSEDHRILPHVVLSDPHLPWERLAGPAPPKNPPPRNRVPWLALFAFTQEELTLDPSLLDGAKSIFAKTSVGLTKPVKQTPTLTVNMPVSDALLVTDVASPFALQKPNDSTKAQRADFIFLSTDLFTSLFSTFDQNGDRQVPANPNTDQYQYLSHVRNINTTGMAIAGVEDNGIFSIVVSRRCGMLDNPKPTPVVVHLVSIEQVENMTFPISEPNVALCSLYSWNYMVLPPDNLNVFDAFTSLGDTLGLLRLPNEVLEPYEKKSKTDPLSKRIWKRMNDGYSVVKYRTQTGEITAALFRGPFTPTTVDTIPEFDMCSNSGIDLQILDRELGLMDITYSSAWQLGRSMALADQAFTAALCRVRSAITTTTLKTSRISIVSDLSKSNFRTRSELFQSLPDTVKRLAQLHMADSRAVDDPFESGGPLKRWHRPTLRKSQFPRMGFRSPLVSEKYEDNAVEAVGKLAKATNGEKYDETNQPVSSDWMIVLAWVVDRMFLDGVPAHYLITDAQHLPHERLQFFFIDPNWVDALIDGALSIGNHMGTDKDRAAIKIMINEYITNTPALQAHAPQIPRYGFYLRSDVVSRFPDLRVTVQAEKGYVPKGTPLLRHNIVADGVMLGLLDHAPGSREFQKLVFTQPPHQQRFAAADGVTTTTIKIAMRRQYTVEQDIRNKDPLVHKPLDVTGLGVPTGYQDKDNVFIWGSKPELKDLHMLRMPRFPDLQLKCLVAKMGVYTDPVTGKSVKYFDDDAATSALFGLQLTDPVYKLVISLDMPANARSLASLTRPGGSMTTPRVFKSLAPSKVEGIHDESDDSDDSHASDDSDNSDDTDDTERSEASDHEESHTMPRIGTSQSVAASRAVSPETFLGPDKSMHVPFLPTMIMDSSSTPVVSLRAGRSQPRPGPGDSGDSGDPASYPTSICQAYNPNINSYTNVYARSGVPEDVIFSVQIQGTKGLSLWMKQFEIRVQMDVVNPNITNCLMPKYNGPGAIMLSNLRFNVLTVPIQEKGVVYLSLRILPRAEAGAIDVTQMGTHYTFKDLDTQELSFILSSVVPNEFPQRVTLVNVSTYASYTAGLDPKSPVKVLENSFQVTLINTNIPPS